MLSNASLSNKLEVMGNNYEQRENEELKEYILRKMAKTIKDNKKINLLWPKLKCETGIACQQLWNQMCDSTTKKLDSLLMANDLLTRVPNTMLLSATDWLLFDLVLVHKKINVTNCKKVPQCIHELYSRVMEHKVENLVGDELADAWLRITLEYNRRGRKCSPMLLQLRWYQLKELSRQQVYKPDLSLDTDKTRLFHGIAIKYQKIITQPFPEWETLVNQKLVILPEQFVEIINREQKWKEIEAREGWYLEINESEIIAVIDIANSDNEIDDVSCEIVNNCTNNDVSKPDLAFNSENNNDKSIIVPGSEPNPATNNRNEIIELDFDDEVDKILEDAEIISTEILETIIENAVKSSDDGITTKIEAVKRKYKQIDKDTNVINEGAKLVNVNKKKRQKMSPIKERSQCNNNVNYDKNYDEFDPKLHMKVIVLTKKLDSMKVFKHIDYSSVHDKKVIECATLESKPTCKRPTQDGDVDMCEQQAFSLHKLERNRIDGHIKQKHKNVYNNTINYSSWLLQKPRYISYNSIKLSKNPDFNIKLKNLTPAFLRSARNNTLLEGCKPLTVDLHKEFEKKLVNGKLYVKGFKSEIRATKSIYNHKAFTRIVTPGYRKEKGPIDAVHDTNDLMDDIGDIQVPRSCTIQTSDDRRKIINLPNIKQIDKFNQSLLTAEVTPICNRIANNNGRIHLSNPI